MQGFIVADVKLSEYNTGTRPWKEHVFCDIADDLPPPRQGLAVPIIEMEVESVDVPSGAHDSDDHITTMRFQITESRLDRTRQLSRAIARDIAIALRAGLTNPERLFTWNIVDMRNVGRYHIVEFTATFLLVADKDTVV